MATPPAQPPKVNWAQVLSDATAAAGKVLGKNWNIVSVGAKNQINNLTNTAKYIAANKNKMTKSEYESIVSDQALSLQTVLLIYKDIDIATAEQAVQAVWTVIGGALQTAAGVAIKIK